MREEPTQERAKETVRRILDVAREIVAESGTGAVTTRTLAERAELPVGTIYRYFMNREDVLEALTAEYRSRMDEVLLSRLARATFDEWGAAIDDIVDGVFDFARANPEFVEIARVTQHLPNLDLRNRETLGRFTSWLERSGLTAALKLEEVQLRAIMTVIVTSLMAILPYALFTGDDEFAENVGAEAKHMMRGYISKRVQDLLGGGIE